ncbi:hypothetical protein ES703_20348 [subsurface metagenome]
MPSRAITALITAVVIAAEIENAVVKAKSMTIDNQDGITDRLVTMQDNFWTDAATGAAAAAQLEERFKVLVGAGDLITFGEEDLKEVKCLGAMSVICDVLDNAADRCYVTVGYEHE